MRRPNREINIFSLSALDLFASALGAFILLAVIQFPYTKKNEDIVNAKQAAEKALAVCKIDLKTKKEQLFERNAALQDAEHEAKQCKERLKNTFLAVILKWRTKGQDIDMHIFDPDGNIFYFKKNNRDRTDFPTVNAEISVDQIKGPGVEVWEYYEARKGLYKIYAMLYSRNGNTNNPIIKTSVYYRDGVRLFPKISLTTVKKKVLVGTIEVDEDGNVTFE